MATIQEVAKRASVSPATVSRVYNNPEIVKEETRNKILAVAKELDYSPSMIARGLKSGVTCIVALIVPDVTNPMFGIFARGCGDKLAEEGMTLALYNSDENLRKEKEIMRVVEQRQTDGVILASRTANLESLDTESYQTNIPCVYIERKPCRKGVDTVHVDNGKAAQLAAEYLIQKGHTRIGIVTGLLHTLTGEQILTSFQTTLQDHDLDLPQEYIYPGNFKMDCGPKIALDIIGSDRPPSAVFFSNDLMAYSAIMMMKDKGVNIPEDIAIVGNVDLAMSEIISPKLTTIRYPIYRHGYKAAEILLDRIKNPGKEEQELLLEPKLIIRESA